MSNEEEADACLLSNRASEPVQAQQQQRPAPVLTSSGAGVAGILRREAQLASQNDEYVDTAFAISTAQTLDGSLSWPLLAHNTHARIAPERAWLVSDVEQHKLCLYLQASHYTGDMQ